MKKIWITGASSGIGEALAYELNSRGYFVVISARTEQALLSVKEKSKFPDKIKILPLDLGEIDQLQSKTDSLISEVGEIDILVNNGGISQRSFAAETKISVDERIMRVNFLGTVALTKALLPHMIKRKSGHIVTVSSMVGKFGTPLRSSYSASKHALQGFMDALRAEVFESGIDVSIICPGYVATDVSKNALTADGSKQNTMDQATANGIEPKEFAKKMANAIEAKKAEAYIAGSKEMFGLYVSRFFPSLFRKLVRKMAVT